MLDVLQQKELIQTNLGKITNEIQTKAPKHISVSTDLRTCIRRVVESHLATYDMRTHCMKRQIL